MQFMAYWELNEDMSVEERMTIAGKLTSSGIFPPEGAKVVTWLGTPDGWGILVIEADDAKAAFRALDSWRASGAGFFKTTKTAPTLSIEEIIPMGQEMLEKLASA